VYFVHFQVNGKSLINAGHQQVVDVLMNAYNTVTIAIKRNVLRVVKSLASNTVESDEPDINPQIS
jgi:hypothetical protein